MDNDTFYDSLEESFSSASSTSVVIVIKPNFSSYVNHVPQEMDNDDVRINLNEIINSTEVSSNASSKTSQVLLENVVEDEYESQIKSVSQYEMCCENSTDKLNKFNARWNKVKESDVSNIARWNKVNDISSIVPLYGGDRNRSEIALSMKSSSTPALNRQKFRVNNKPSTVLTTKSSTVNKNKQRSKFTKSNYRTSDSSLSIDSLPKPNPTKSYLKIFHSRIGYPTAENSKKFLDDTTRSIFGDSSRSYIEEESGEEFADAEAGYGSDTTSQSKTEHLPPSPESFESSIPPSNIVSVSELLLNSNVKTCQKKTRIPKRPNLTPVPILGRLGPDPQSIQEKLERRKRQISYGQKASNRNRIKMVESKVLKNLNKEMLKSNCVTDEIQKL